MSRHLVLISDARETCGVEAFARLTATHLGMEGLTAVLGGPLPESDDVVINLPVVAWKRRLLAPIGAALAARLGGRDVTVVLHEWADLAVARRVAYLPLLPLATRLFFSAPEVMAQFAATPVSAIVTKRRGVLPIPPNLDVPVWIHSSPASQALAAERAAGRLVLGQFGSIYPKKDPGMLLEAASALVRRGVDLRLVLVGSFVGEGVEVDFLARTKALGLADRVSVTGYVADAAELQGLLSEVDVFCYPLSEGLTSRRGSVLTAALSGRPVVVTAPADTEALAHHRLFQSLVAAGALHLAPRGASPDALADAILAARGLVPRPVDARAEVAALWAEVARRIAGNQSDALRGEQRPAALV